MDVPRYASRIKANSGSHWLELSNNTCLATTRTPAVFSAAFGLRRCYDFQCTVAIKAEKQPLLDARMTTIQNTRLAALLLFLRRTWQTPLLFLCETERIFGGRVSAGWPSVLQAWAHSPASNKTNGFTPVDIPGTARTHA